MDLMAAIDSPLVLESMATATVPTGIALELPTGLEGQIRPRSGLARDHRVTILNSPGTIDADYRGELGVLLINLGNNAFTVRRGDRVAQLVIASTIRAEWRPVDDLGASERDSGGYGHTGR